MRIINYLNGISYIENVVEGIDLNSISYEKKELVLGQNEIYHAEFNIGKNDENLVLKTFFYKSLFSALSLYFKSNSIVEKVNVWTRNEDHFIQLPGTEGSFEVLDQHAAMIASLGKGKMKILTDKNNSTSYEINSGFIEVLNNKATVLIEGAIAL